MGTLSRAEFWSTVRTDNEGGRKARLEGWPITANPYSAKNNVNPDPKKATSWEMGWKAEDGELRTPRGAPPGMPLAYYDGWLARVVGRSVTDGSGYPVGSEERNQWLLGWTEKQRLQDLANDRAARSQRAREEHDAAYSAVVERLSELGIDPHRLRDYLAGLPSEE